MHKSGHLQKALQLFYLKSMMGNNKIPYREVIKEFFISNSAKKDRTPANIILRLLSGLNQNKQTAEISQFIENSCAEVLSSHFITPEMIDLYRQNRIDEFIDKREIYLKSGERQFVESLDIEYVD